MPSDIQIRSIAPGDQNARSFLVKALRTRKSNAAASAGYDGNFPSQSFHVALSPHLQDRFAVK